MKDLSEYIPEFENVDILVQYAMVFVAGLIVIVSIVSFVVSIWLALRYVRFNRTKNSCGLAGKDVARRILDENGLKHIKVSCTGSLIFGNSYGHYFKKVRLRRFTYKKDSISSLAMAAQKSSLALLDKEDDPDMKQRIRLVPIITFGPFMCIPLIIVGIILDIIFFNFTGVITIVFATLGLLFYVLSFVLSLMVLKTEKKAQERAYNELKNRGLATEEELSMMKELFHLYNIQYVNDLILELLELIYRVLQIVANVQQSSRSRD